MILDIVNIFLMQNQSIFLHSLINVLWPLAKTWLCNYGVSFSVLIQLIFITGIWVIIIFTGTIHPILGNLTYTDKLWVACIVNARIVPIWVCESPLLFDYKFPLCSIFKKLILLFFLLHYSDIYTVIISRDLFRQNWGTWQSWDTCKRFQSHILWWLICKKWKLDVHDKK